MGLKGSQVALRAYRAGDAPDIQAWVWGDPAVVPHPAFWDHPQSLAETEAFLAAMMAPQPDPPLAVNLAMALADDPQARYIGGCGLHAIDWRNRNAMLGIVIGRPDLHGRGLGTEAVTLLLGHAFDALGLHQVGLTCFEYNERGLRCYRRCGFREEGRLRERRFH